MLRALTVELRIDKALDLSGCASLRTLSLTLHKVTPFLCIAKFP